MTYRERKEARLEKRLEWAAGRRDKAAKLYARAEPYRGDVAFNTQPGHIPERARVIRAVDKSFEHSAMAATHESKAAEIERQLDRSIYDDDPDAVTQLEARIAAHEAQRERMKAENKAYRKGEAAFAALLGITPEQAAARRVTIEAGYSWHRQPHPAYELSNLGGRITTDRKRLETIQARQERSARAEAAPGGVVIEGGEWVQVTFAEKPDRAIIDALKAAGFSWGGGSWIGQRATLPAEVTA